MEAFRDLAWFRYQLRKFLRFSEKAAQQCGITHQHHQLMLGVAGFTGSGCATVSELAEFLQERHNSVVGLVERAVTRGLVRKEQDAVDRRRVVVSLTPLGEDILGKLSKLHQAQIKQVQAGFFTRQSHAPEGRKTATQEHAPEGTAIPRNTLSNE